VLVPEWMEGVDPGEVGQGQRQGEAMTRGRQAWRRQPDLSRLAGLEPVQLRLLATASHGLWGFCRSGRERLTNQDSAAAEKTPSPTGERHCPRRVLIAFALHRGRRRGLGSGTTYGVVGSWVQIPPLRFHRVHFFR